MSERRGAAWEGWTAEGLARRWSSPEVHLFDSLGSSNDVARRLASAGSPAGTVVLAEEQVAGRGRAGRGWASPPGVGLWFSVIGAPLAGAEGGVGTLPLRVGIAVATALDPFLPAPGVGIKWPNDLWVGDRKLGGILCEATWEGGRPGGLVAGVGLNLLQEPEAFPAELREHATSLAREAGRPPSRLDVADRVVPAVIRAVTGEAVLSGATLAARDLLRGRAVRVSDPMTGREIARGVAAGIAADGALLLRDDAGAELRVLSGTVRAV